MKLSAVLVWMTVSFVGFPLLSQAANSGDVIFNEIAWMGTEVSGVDPKNWWRYEWIELYNKTDQTIDLMEWKLELAEQDVEWTLNLKSTIAPLSYFLIVSSEKIPNFDLNYAKLDGKLANGGQRVILKDVGGNVIDEVDARNNWFEKGDNIEKKTMERKRFASDSNDSLNWETSLEKGGTPRAPNSVAVIFSVSTPISTPVATTSSIPSPSPTQTFSSTPIPSNTPPSISSGASLSLTPTRTPSPAPSASQASVATPSFVPSVSSHATSQVSQSTTPIPSLKTTSTPKARGVSAAAPTKATSLSISASPSLSDTPEPEKEETLAAVSGATAKPLILSIGTLLIVVLGTLGVLWKYVMK